MSIAVLGLFHMWLVFLETIISFHGKLRHAAIFNMKQENVAMLPQAIGVQKTENMQLDVFISSQSHK